MVQMIGQAVGGLATGRSTGTGALEFDKLLANLSNPAVV